MPGQDLPPWSFTFNAESADDLLLMPSSCCAGQGGDTKPDSCCLQQHMDDGFLGFRGQFLPHPSCWRGMQVGRDCAFGGLSQSTWWCRSSSSSGMDASGWQTLLAGILVCSASMQWHVLHSPCKQHFWNPFGRRPGANLVPFVAGLSDMDILQARMEKISKKCARICLH